MKKITGLKLDKFPLNDLEAIADFIYFDGPLLTHFKNRNDESYLYSWCDVDEAYNRWLIFRVTNQSLNLYLTKQLSLHELILNPIDGFLYSVDIDDDDDLQPSNVHIVRPTDLPIGYIPQVNSYYKFEPLFFEREEAEENPREAYYRISLDGEWKLPELSDFLQTYNEVYSFLYSLQTPPAAQNNLEKHKQAYIPSGSVTFHNALTALVPEQHLPKVASMHYASPGWIELELFMPTALSIQTLIFNAIRSSKDLKTIHDEISKEMQVRELSANLVAKERELSEDDALFIEKASHNLAHLMGFNDLEQLNEFTHNPLVTLNILLSFYSSINKLAQYQRTSKLRYYS